MERLRVGVIGAGVGAAHLAGYALLPQVEIVALAVASPAAENARASATMPMLPVFVRRMEELSPSANW